MPPTATAETPGELRLADAATMPAGAVLTRLGSGTQGLSADEAGARRTRYGPNALHTARAQPWLVFARQLRNPLLLLLLAAAVVSAITGELADAVIIGVIVTLSVGLGFLNEYRSEQAVQALHESLRHNATVTRGGHPVTVDVVDLVPGDVLSLRVGDIVPADVRLLETTEFECNEAVLTGESLATDKSSNAVTEARTPQDLSSCAFMGTIVQHGSATAAVVTTGARTEFGRIAAGLGERPAQTAFQAGLARFSSFLVRVAAVLTVSIFVINLVLHRPFLDALLFSLAIAIGLTPQLLPAIVTVSLSTGARRLAERKVLVKHLVSIEDLGNITILFSDKTGTLTDGSITFDQALDAKGTASEHARKVHLLGLVCNEAQLDGTSAVSGNQLDVALWDAAGELADEALRWSRIATLPFDHERRVASVLATAPDGTTVLVTKGEPEKLLARCDDLPAGASSALDALFDAGARVIAVGTKPMPATATLDESAEHGLLLAGFLTFVDPPKADAAASIERLSELGIEVKVITGDSERVARKVCTDLGMHVAGSLTGVQLETMDDAELTDRISTTTVFARIGPEQKARIIRVQRAAGADVGFIGDGVNDAVALHHADVGISVDSATDVAKDAADVVLLERNLGVLAEGVVEGRRIFANTMKYVLMATSSNFGNMFSAAGASAVLSYLPMLPSQILLNNLLYDVGQMTIPTDEVDEELLRRPSDWDIRFIRRFMTVFGPLSSLFDFATFALLIHALDATQSEFRAGWFVESLATQSLIIFVIRTRRVPFVRSRPSVPLLATTLTMAAIGVVLPFSPLASTLGFTSLPASYFAMLATLFALYLVLAELAKRWFFAAVASEHGVAPHRPVAHRSARLRRIARRSMRFTHTDRRAKRPLDAPRR